MTTYRNDGSGIRTAAARPTELWRWTASETAHGIRTGLISAVEATRAALARIDALNPRLNALVEVYPEEALAAAGTADRAVRAGTTLGPLHGVPTAIKVNTDERGHATTDGVEAFKDRIASEDAPVTANLRKAGAIFVGRSNTPAFSMRWFCDNDLHGRTLNPWNADCTPGGSSGGAGAAAASGMVGIAHGNDIGGSIRYPAYVCGVAGIRPTVGRVPTYWGDAENDPPLGHQSMAVHGPLARCIADLRLALDAMAAPDWRDLHYAPVPARLAEPARPIRVALVRDAGIARPAPAINAALDRAAAWLTDAGYVVEETTLPVLKEAWEINLTIVMEEMKLSLPFIMQRSDDNGRRATELYFSTFEREFGPLGQERYMRTYYHRAAAARALHERLSATPLVLLPVSAELAFPYGSDVTDTDASVALMRAQWPMSAIPALGCPALSVPTGVADGLPTGVQLLAGRFREDLILDAAEIIEARAGTLTPIDPVG
jgi:amidase